MNKRIILSAFFAIVFSSSNAQNFWLEGKIDGFFLILHPAKVYLFHQAPFRETELLDSALIDDNGNFHFTNKKIKQAGLFYLKSEKGSGFSFAASPTETIHIKSTVNDFLKGKANLSGSRENDLFIKLEAIAQAMKSEQNKRDSMVKTINPYAPRFNELATALREQFYHNMVQLNNAIKTLRDNYKESFSVNILAGLYHYPLKQSSPAYDTLFDNNVSFLHYHFFDEINFSSPEVCSTELLYDKIDEYLSLHIDASEFKGIKEGIDILFGKINNSEVKGKVAFYLIDYYSRKNNYSITEYLFNTYYSSGCEIESNEETANLVNRMKALTPGNVAPEIVLPDENGKQTKLSAIKNEKAIVVFFWASWCAHCTEGMKDVVRFYNQYKDKGLEIYAVSFDYTRDEWVKYLLSNPIPWINVAEGKGTATDIVKTYGIHQTPTFFLLDGKQKIILRTNELAELEESLVTTIFISFSQTK